MKQETMTAAEYRVVPFAVGYRVGNDGTVWTCRNGRWGLRAEYRQLRAAEDASGYLSVVFRMPDKTSKTFRVHALVLRLFKGETTVGHEALHGNGIKADCRLDNLRWGTRAENVADAIAHGAIKTGQRSHLSVLTDALVREIRSSTESGKQIAMRLQVSNATISQVRSRKTWRHVV